MKYQFIRKYFCHGLGKEELIYYKHGITRGTLVFLGNENDFYLHWNICTFNCNFFNSHSCIFQIICTQHLHLIT